MQGYAQLLHYYKPNFVAPDEQIYLLREQLRQAEEEYMRLWNQHKLLKLSYRFLKSGKMSHDTLAPASISDNFQAFLYGTGRGLPLEFQKPVRRRNNNKKNEAVCKLVKKK
ncbi:hypothetical protein U0035_02080 [Niabella yanshanensis]|uniref:Transposase n=1 Tax=Niabella yanshanensis TaxID=577386 RepID=A0ABZ0W6Q7_9BACT|nr:hypothetical protein [Niabella yanshanensis]WQD38932.1 hypothetical protein U0035_02080 [Niabella yanshanensis]